MYHFLSGFTSKVAGTERGVTEPQPTFSTCFGAPFMPRRPEVYGNLLREKIAKHGATCWLVNTGWTGGAYGTGSRMPIKATRALAAAALDGSLAGGRVPQGSELRLRGSGVGEGRADILLDPRRTWESGADYDRQAAKLVDDVRRELREVRGPYRRGRQGDRDRRITGVAGMRDFFGPRSCGPLRRAVISLLRWGVAKR
jgi:phosphoenolpyruvate carboxykinase (ATP)